MKQNRLILSGLILACSVTGCVDSDYDWGKLEPEITVLNTGCRSMTVSPSAFFIRGVS